MKNVQKHSVTVIRPKSGYDLVVSKKTGRNALCPCGSGKKAKHCCGTETQYYSAKAAKQKEDTK